MLSDQQQQPAAETSDPQPTVAENGKADRPKPFHKQCGCGKYIPARCGSCPHCGAAQPKAKQKPRAKQKPKLKKPAKPESSDASELLAEAANRFRQEGVQQAIAALRRLLD